MKMKFLFSNADMSKISFEELTCGRCIVFYLFIFILQAPLITQKVQQRRKMCGWKSNTLSPTAIPSKTTLISKINEHQNPMKWKKDMNCNNLESSSSSTREWKNRKAYLLKRTFSKVMFQSDNSVYSETLEMNEHPPKRAQKSKKKNRREMRRKMKRKT